MRQTFLPFSKPSINYDDIDAVTNVLRSGWITTGPQCIALETEFLEYTHNKHAIALTSATAAMHLILLASGVGPGDEVITPSMTWVSTINIISLLGATPVFVDVNKDTLMIEAAEIEKKITSKTKVIIPVHFAGAPADMDAIYAIANKYNCMVIEDAAHALGTFYKGKIIGNKGTAIFSFHPIKNITTGEGGMICTDNKEMALRVRRLKFHGLEVDAFDKHTQGRSPNAQVIEPGFKYNLTDISAALGLSQIKRIKQFNSKRALLASEYDREFSKIPEILPLKTPSYKHTHSHHLYIIRLNITNCPTARDNFMEELKQQNVGTGLHFKPVHQHLYYRTRFPLVSLLNTEWNGDRMLSLPLFPDMTIDDVHSVVEAIKEVLHIEQYD